MKQESADAIGFVVEQEIKLVLIHSLDRSEDGFAHPNHLRNERADLRGVTGPGAKDIFAVLRTLSSQPSQRGRSGKLNKPSTALLNRIEMLHRFHKRLVTILIDF